MPPLQVSHKVNGLIMAFGAGALLFAVAIEMFAAGIREEEEGKNSKMPVLVLFSVVGAIFYTIMNQCLTGGKPDSHGDGHDHGSEGNENGKSGNGYEKVSSAEEGKAKPVQNTESAVAFSIWLGILIDGVPESMLIGFMQSEGELSVAFIVAVFLANFPEAMSASAIMCVGAWRAVLFGFLSRPCLGVLVSHYSELSRRVGLIPGSGMATRRAKFYACGPCCSLARDLWPS